MQKFLIVPLLIALPLIGTGCSPLSWLHGLYAQAMAEIAQNAAENDEPPEPQDDPVAPHVYWDADTLNAVSPLPYNTVDAQYNPLLGKWRVQVIQQRINNENYRIMIPKGKTIVIESNPDGIPEMPTGIISGNYFEDYSTEYVSPDFFENWFEELPNEVNPSSAFDSLDDIKYVANIPGFVGLQYLTCEHSGITQGNWDFRTVPSTLPDGTVIDALGINFNQVGNADLSSKCGYNFNGEQHLMPNSSGWRSFPIGAQTWETTFDIMFPYYDTGDYNTVILRNNIFLIGLERIQ